MDSLILSWFLIKQPAGNEEGNEKINRDGEIMEPRDQIVKK